jgi:hypothetical protein
MKQENLLRLRIAALKLYRVLPNAKIAIADNEFYDLLITDELEGLAFAAKVGSTKMFETEEYKGYIAKIGSLKIDSIKYPIIAISVNETTEDVKIGIITSVRFNSIRIINKPIMVSITKENASILSENVKLMDSVIRTFSSGNCGVIKNCTIKIKRNDRRIDTAHAIYLRPLSNNYKMKQVQISNKKERFERLSLGTPEKDYPSDIFDDVIDKGLKQLYHDAEITVQSSLLLSNTDFANLKAQINTHAKPIDLEFIIEPNIDEAIREWGFFNSIHFHLELYPGKVALVGNWRDDVCTIPLGTKDWTDFYNLYKSGSLPKTDVSQLIAQM